VESAVRGVSRWLNAAALILAGMVLAGAPAFADGPASSLTVGGGDNFVPGGAATDFHMDFLLSGQHATSGTDGQNLQISLSSPSSTGMLHFLFSPRTQYGVGYDPIYGTNRSYTGLTWDLFSADSVYGQLGFASSFDPEVSGADASRHATLAPLMLHGAVEFGYRFNTWNSVSLAIDQGMTPVAHGTAPESFDNFVLRYGVKF
jgi:hypothetical protein